MTTPTQPTPTPAKSSTTNTIRAIISVLETVAFIVATALAAMNNGSDFKNAIITALVGFIAHGVNHTAGGSPI